MTDDDPAHWMLTSAHFNTETDLEVLDLPDASSTPGLLQ